jgi:triosephosphate isomerase
LKDLPLDAITIAYEPIWAIGTGKTATKEQANETHEYIRGWLRKNKDGADNVRIQYGGSVKPDNIEALMSESEVDGALVGGASLKPDSFAGIVKGAAKNN